MRPRASANASRVAKRRDVEQNPENFASGAAGQVYRVLAARRDLCKLVVSTPMAAPSRLQGRKRNILNHFAARTADSMPAPRCRRSTPPSAPSDRMPPLTAASHTFRQGAAA